MAAQQLDDLTVAAAADYGREQRHGPVAVDGVYPSSSSEEGLGRSESSFLCREMQRVKSRHQECWGSGPADRDQTCQAASSLVRLACLR